MRRGSSRTAFPLANAFKTPLPPISTSTSPNPAALPPAWTASPLMEKKLIWASYGLSALPILMLLSGAVNAFRMADFVLEGTRRLGYPDSLVPIIGVIELLCAATYLFPLTAVLGAILMTGYLGGGVASHRRIGDPTWPAPVLFGAMVWGGLYLRDRRLRELLPLG